VHMSMRWRCEQLSMRSLQMCEWREISM
jgi:hypothetical protein